MSKPRLIIRCQQCGYLSSKWLGRCPECGEWDSFLEEAAEPDSAAKGISYSSQSPQLLQSVTTLEQDRLKTGISEFDRVLGGGVTPGSVVLIGGEPGIGKSTLLLQVSDRIASNFGSVLVVSGEESPGQIKMRADRLGAKSDSLYLLTETNVEAIKIEIEKLQPVLVVIDSIQTMFHPDIASAPGSVSQIRESAAQLLQVAKLQGFSIFLIGHVTKEGAIAGPRILEHMVDTVLYFEGDGRELYRIIRAVKNRFGSTNEVGVFEMSENGLKEVIDPSSFFLRSRAATYQGSIILPTMEGTRPVLVEVQSLVTPSYLAMPRRLSSGIEFNRFTLMAAILERRANVKLANHDVYVSVGGGIKVVEPAADLAIGLAVYSAYKDLEVPAELIAFGEVSLSGEIRPVSRSELRLNEAVKLGFKKAILPAQPDKNVTGGVRVFPVRTLREAIDELKKIAARK